MGFNRSSVWLVMLVVSLVWGMTNGEACYEPFGCFPITDDFKEHRLINVEPEPPRLIDAHFYLYAKWLQNDSIEEACEDVTMPIKGDDQYAPCLITTNILMDHSQLSDRLERIASHSNATGEEWLAVVAHGYLDGPRVTSWMPQMKNLLLKQTSERPYDLVVLVDWTGGNRMPYSQATANTRLVGAEIAYLLRHLTQHLNRTNDRVHVIGHSLGAHIAGYAAKNFTEDKLGRVTALDPAGPAFEGTPATVRVSQNDAQFVDAIHTNGHTAAFPDGYGTLEQTAQLDFYPNGAHDQPGCVKDAVKPPKEFESMGFGTYELACNHVRAVLYFLHSIPQADQKYCSFPSVQCDSWSKYQEGECGSAQNCTDDGASCPQMGFFAYRATQFPPNTANDSTKLYLQTDSESPYC